MIEVVLRPAVEAEVVGLSARARVAARAASATGLRIEADPFAAVVPTPGARDIG